MVKYVFPSYDLVFSFLAHRSQRLTRWAYSITRLRRPSSTLSNKNISQDQLASFSQMLSVASLRKGCIRFLGRSDQNCGYHGNGKLPLTYNWKNSVATFSPSSLIGSLSNLQVTRTSIKSRMSLNLGQVRLFIISLYALEHFHWLWMGENGVSIFSQLLWTWWILSSSNVQEMRTGIKSRTSSTFGHIWPVILELYALERWKKWCLQLRQSPLIGFLSN